MNIPANQAKQPQNYELIQMMTHTKEYYMNESQKKLEIISKNYNDLTSFVTHYTFSNALLEVFTEYIDYQQALSLKTHTTLLTDLNKIMI